MNRLSLKRKEFYAEIRRQQINEKINYIRKITTYE